MLRSFIRLSRPKGPPGLRPGNEYRYVVPYRSEVAMLSLATHKKINCNIRELFKKPLEANNIKAIPRDLGELPRYFVVSLLFMHQPIRLLDLWELCKQHNDVPLDSAKHLRLVLKIAKIQKWVYCEKNQSDNFYYYYLHRSRTHEVQEMIHEREINLKAMERAMEADASRHAEETEKEKDHALDESIMQIQRLIDENMTKLSGHISDDL